MFYAARFYFKGLSYKLKAGKYVKQAFSQDNRHAVPVLVGLSREG